MLIMPRRPMHLRTYVFQVNLYCAAKLGLENISALHKAIGSPLQRVPNIVHVGGMYVAIPPAAVISCQTRDLTPSIT